MKVGLVVVGFVLMTFPQAGWAWDNFETHHRLADVALARANVDGALDLYLRNELGRVGGLSAALALQSGFDETLDDQLRSQRFGRSLSVLEGLSRPWKCAPATVGVYLDENEFQIWPCTSPPAESVYGVRHLIRAGTFGEDSPNPRARHHFHDPQTFHAPPEENRGLDNNIPNTTIDTFLAEQLTALRGGSFLRAISSSLASFFGPLVIDSEELQEFDIGNFDLTGRSALDRALNRSIDGETRLPSDASPDNLFALPDAERYLFRALTAPSGAEREHFLGLHFLSFGSVLHLLQDMGSVAHTRNDFLLDHIVGILSSLESFAAGETMQRRLESLRLNPDGSLGENPPRLVLPASLAADFDQELPLPDTTGFDAADYWQTGVIGSSAGLGLAELANSEFFSRGTISNSGELGYPSPLVPAACDTSLGVGSGPSWISELPTRNRDGIVEDPTEREKFLSSALVPHLARCGFHSNLLASLTGAPPYLSFGLTDSSVQHDYAEILLALTVDYTSKFIEFYYQPRIEVIPVGDGDFRLANRTSLPFEASSDAIAIAYDDVDGNRIIVGVSCSEATSLVLPALAQPNDRIGPASNLVCSMPDTLPSPARLEDDFWVVVRGQLGSRGELVSGSGESTWKDEDFVVAFRHVQPTLMVDRRPPRIEGETETDSGVDLDIIRVGFDPTVEAPELPDPPAGEPVQQFPPFTGENLTARFREIDDRDDLDFLAPQAENTGQRLLIRSDRESAVDPGSTRPDIQAPLDAFVFDPFAIQSELLVLTPIPGSQIAESADFETIRVRPSPDYSSVFLYRDLDDPYSLVRWTPSGGIPESFASPFLAFTSNVALDTTPDELNVGDLVETCNGVESFAPALDDTNTIRLAVGAACETREVVEAPSGSQVFSQVSIGTNVLIMDIVDGGGALDGVYTHRMDMDLLQVVPCETADPGCWRQPGFVVQTDPVWAPDGNRLAFLHGEIGPTNRSLFVADVDTGVITELVADDHGKIFSPTWSPDGRWLAFSIVEIGEECPCEAYVVDSELLQIQLPRRVTLGAGIANTLTWFDLGLRLPETP